jgi:hypothetical protein
MDFTRSRQKITKGNKLFSQEFQSFTNIPLLCTMTPGNSIAHAIGSLGVAGGGPHRNPARPAAELATEVGECD